MQREVLSDEDLKAAVDRLDGWRVSDGRLQRDYTFPDFIEAFGFMSRVALVAQSMDHHPDWTNVYNRVSVQLHTHDRNGITGWDVRLAEKMNELAASAASS